MGQSAEKVEEAGGDENNLRVIDRVRGEEKEGIMLGVVPCKAGERADFRDETMMKKLYGKQK